MRMRMRSDSFCLAFAAECVTRVDTFTRGDSAISGWVKKHDLLKVECSHNGRSVVVRSRGKSYVDAFRCCLLKASRKLAWHK